LVVEGLQEQGQKDQGQVQEKQTRDLILYLDQPQQLEVVAVVQEKIVLNMMQIPVVLVEDQVVIRVLEL
tara:strand:+ start:111 stop:317 length:207 start_codon:yes stop_codon:yes gene_type:complete